MGWLKLVELKSFRLKDGVLVQGLPGIGLVGKIAVDYIISELKLEKVAELYSDGLLLPIGNAGVLIDNKAVIKVPRYEFYLYSGSRDILFLTGDVQPVSWAQYEVANAVLDFFQERGGVEVVAVCGTTAGEEGVKEVYFAACSPEICEWLKGLGFKPSEGGTITGACGLLPALAALRGLKAYALMGTTHRPEPDPEASREIVKALNKIFGVQVNLENLNRMIEEIKKRQEEFKKFAELIAKETRRTPSYYV